MTYEGFCNAATWSVNLWVTHVQSIRDRLLAATPLDGWGPQSAREFVWQTLPQGTPEVTPQGYSQVNWEQISERWNTVFG